MSSVLPLLGVTLFAGAILAGTRGPSPRDADRLAMAAQASGRPAECRTGRTTASREQRLTVWDRVRQPHLQRYCDLLGRAQTQLEGSPSAAREAALLAEQVLPGKAAPWVLVGRAHVRLRDFPQALRDFEKARSIDARSIEDPPSLHDLALAQREAGKLSDAMNTYRVLVPRLGLLPTTDDRVEVLIEAAALAMNGGNDGLDEAAALLSEARAQPLSKYDSIVLGMLALTLDRAGMRQESEAVLEIIHRGDLAQQLVGQDPSSLRFLAAGDWDAVLALALELDDRPRAITSWERYLGTKPQPVFAAHAQKRLETLRRAAPRYTRP